MQKDEEVGKVAQATPIVICMSHSPFLPAIAHGLTSITAKALELFLQLVVDEASRVTTARGSKKVEAYHLCVRPFYGPLFITHRHYFRKHAIETTEMLDFLKELVEGVPDPSAGGTVPFDVPGENDPTPSSRRKGKKVAAVDDGDEDGAAAAPAKKRRRRKKVEARESDSGGTAAMADGERDEPMHDIAPPNRGDENWEEDDETGGFR